MSLPEYTVASACDRDDIMDKSDVVVHRVWPTFMLKDPVANNNWGDLFEYFPEFQFALFDRETDEVLAAANSIAFHFDGASESLPDEGWDWVVQKGIRDAREGRTPNYQSALQIVIAPEYAGTGLSYTAVNLMKEIGRSRGLPAMVAPVRPNAKPQYPLAAMDDYVRWTNGEGLPFDPWMRVHARLGARVCKVCPKAMHIEGTVAEWEEWTGMRFPQSDRYVVPGALLPVAIDCEADRGVYIEPNVWMCHEL